MVSVLVETQHRRVGAHRGTVSLVKTEARQNSHPKRKPVGVVQKEEPHKETVKSSMQGSSSGLCLPWPITWFLSTPAPALDLLTGVCSYFF